MIILSQMMHHIIFASVLLSSCFAYSTVQITTTAQTQVTDEPNFWTAFVTFSIGGIPVIITLSIFFCIACVTGNCSLWWYFNHLRRENVKLIKENKHLERHLSGGELPPELDLTNHSKPNQSADEYYENHYETNAERVFSLSVIRETTNGVEEEEDIEDEKQELTQRIEITTDDDDDDNDSEYKHNETQPKKKSFHISHRNASCSPRAHKATIATLKRVITDMKENIYNTYHSRAQIPDLCHARRDHCTKNDLWKEIDKLKAIIYWYDSAMKGHLLFCNEEYIKATDPTHKHHLKLSDVTSHMSLPERNMHIIEIHKNDQDALQQEHYLTLMQKISSLNDIMLEEEKMCSPRYDLYEKFRCEECDRTKRGLDEIMIFEQCYHLYCIDCLKHRVVQSEQNQHIMCPFPGCYHALSRYEMEQIQKRIRQDEKEQEMAVMLRKSTDDEKVYDTIARYREHVPRQRYRGFSILSGASVRSFGKIHTSGFRETVALEYTQLVSKLAAISKQQQMDGNGNKAKLIEFLNGNRFGKNELFTSSFGVRPVIYCDWMTSGNALKCVERYIDLEVLTMYSSNRHSTPSSVTTTQTNTFLSQSKSIILNSIGGNTRNDAIVFTGTGSTDAIYKLANILLSNRNGTVGFQRYNGFSTIVFVSIYETESNVYIWKELGCTVIVIPEDKDDGIGIDIGTLERHLRVYTQKEMKTKYNLLIGSFTAASNVCGIITKHNEITDKLHEYGALSFWDFGCCAPYIDIDMDNKDAVFVEAHRFIGGVEGVGILCAKKHLFVNYVPVIPASGTLFYSYGAEDGQYQYIDNIEEREEGSTLHIACCVRSALAFMIKDSVSTSFISMKHEYNLNYFLKHCGNIKNLKIIGYTRNKSITNRLPIISFEIKYKNKYLHYNFVAALMNDLFGIQGYAGNASAGMYCKYSLNLTDAEMKHMIKQMSECKNELSRPGYYQLTLHFTLSQQELAYITNAVQYVCEHGWKFLPLYDIDMRSGNYYHRSAYPAGGTRGGDGDGAEWAPMQLRSLLDIHVDELTGKLCWKDNHSRFKSDQLEKNLNRYFELADAELNNLKVLLPTRKEISCEEKVNDKHSWYWLPSEMFTYVVEYAFDDIIIPKHVNKQIMRRKTPKRKYIAIE